MAPELPVGSDKRRIKAQMFQFRHVNRIQSELQHPLKDFVILMQGIDYPQLDITAIASHPVVVLVLAVLAAEFSVCPAILDLIPTFKTDCKLAVIFSFISHITASLVTSNVANGKENAKTMWRNTGNRPEIFLFLSDSQFFRTGQKKFMVHAEKRNKQKKKDCCFKKEKFRTSETEKVHDAGQAHVGRYRYFPLLCLCLMKAREIKADITELNVSHYGTTEQN